MQLQERNAPARSLQATLLLWLLVPLAVALPLRAYLQYQQTVRQTHEAIDEGLADTALALANLVRVEHGRARLLVSPESERLLRTDQTDTVYLALSGPRGEPWWGEPALGSYALHGLITQPSRGVRFGQASIGGQPVRVAALPVPCPQADGDPAARCEVRVAETLHKRQRIETEALRDTVGFFVLLVGVEVLLILVAVRISMRPLRRLSEEVAQRPSHDLRPLQGQQVPTELRPLIDATNQLFDRVREANAAQQAFIADAAHQLRTPLTSLRTEAELALLETPKSPSHEALTRIHRSAERAARLASQLLAQARTDSRTRGDAHRERFDLRAVAEQAATDWVPQALRDGVDLGFQLDSAPALGQPYLLRELLGNLIHNALEYARPLRGADTRITVRTRREDEHSILEVEDNGPGIPAHERERVLQRFQRGNQSSGTGSGLGLAIVQDIVEDHGGELQLLDAGTEPGDLPGLCVRIRFPTA